jgi:hypothetical protein
MRLRPEFGCCVRRTRLRSIDNEPTQREAFQGFVGAIGGCMLARMRWKIAFVREGLVVRRHAALWHLDKDKVDLTYQMNRAP